MREPCCVGTMVMRQVILPIAVLVLLAPATAVGASGGVDCTQIPEAQRFVDKLQPGPNRRAAQRYLEAARHARSERQCVADLRRVDHYARRSAQADKRLGAETRTAEAPPEPGPPPTAAADPSPQPQQAAPVRHRIAFRRCADWLHQDRPGGSDYRGPPRETCR